MEKPKFLTDGLEPNIDIFEEEIHQIKSVLLRYISVEDIFGKINKKLRTSYLTRREDFIDEIFEKENFIKIPRSKMNLEERILLAFFTNSNIKNDLNEILEYMNKMFEIIRYGNESKIDEYEEEMTKLIITNSLTNHFAAKIRILIPDTDDDDDKPYDIPHRSEEEIKKDFEELTNHPLFLTEMPENLEDNELLRAIQAAKFEGSADDIAIEFLTNSKNSLDLYVKSKQFKHLKDAMIHICDAIDHVKDDQEISPKMKHEIYFFRGGIQMMVKNYGYAIDDFKQALKLIDKDEVHLKIAECYMNLEENEKAKQIIEEKLKNNASQNKKNEVQINNEQITNLENKNIVSKLTEKLNKINLSEKERQFKIQNLEVFKNMKSEEKDKLCKLLNDRGIKLKPQFHNIPQNYEAKIFLDDENMLHFPVLIIYDEFNMTEYLRDVEENSLISDILETLFETPVPADKEKKYNLNTVKCFLEMSDFDSVLKKETNLYFPLRNDEKLIDVLQHKKVYMNGIPVIYIISQINQFYTHFMNNKIILNRSLNRNKFSQITSK